MVSSHSSRLVLGDDALDLARLRAYAREPATISVSKVVDTRLAKGRSIIERRIADGVRTYGVNTGFGSLAAHQIGASDLAELQRRLILSNAAGTGPLMADDSVRLMILMKLNALATGQSGVRPAFFDALLSLLNSGIVPCVPSKGSVGASGDLAPLAHMGATLLGIGDVRLDGKVISASAALKMRGLTPLALEAKEGLAIVNGTQASTALLLSGLFAAERVLAAAIVAGALSVEAALGQEMPFDDRLHRARGQRGQRAVANLYRSLLVDSAFRPLAAAQGRLQDPYCLRCQPQVMGACLDQIAHAAAIAAREANAWTDNPMVDLDTGDVLYGGNFHAEPVGFAADGLALAIAEIGAMSERRIAMLTDPHHSKLPAFLVKETGLDSGFMVAQVTAAALASENKSLAHPASVDSIPTTANHEDFVSMATFAARRLGEMADNAATIVAIELLAACQGVELRRPVKSSERLEDVIGLVREHVSHYDTDRFMAPDIAAAKRIVLSDALLDLLPELLPLLDPQTGAAP